MNGNLAKMKAVLLLALGVGIMNAYSADILKELECHDKVVQHGIKTLSFAREVNSLFGPTNVDHFISNFGSKVHAPIWNSVTYFGGRYTLALQVPIAIDYEDCRLIGATGPAVISVNEVVKVELSASGNAQATLKGGIGPNRGELSESEWQRLVKSRGDWSAVNLPIATNRPPVKNFDEYVRQAREPILNRKEGFDKPVKKAIEALREPKNLPNVNESNAALGSGGAGAPVKRLDCYERVVRHAIETLILPGEVNLLFGATNVDHFISGFGSKNHAPLWNSVTYFAGRYRLALRVPILVDYEKCRLVGATDSAIVQINEVTKVELAKSGIVEATMKGQWRLNENEWKWLVRNHGDWFVVKVPILTNAPVKGFDEYVRQGREPLRNRKEGFDRPIRRAIETLRKQQGNADKADNKNER